MLEPVPGTPICGNFVQLKTEFRANGKYVPYSLGGGSQGHLGLVFVTTYICINTNTVSNHHAHPGPLEDMTKLTQFQKVEDIRIHKETVGTSNLCNLVERTITNQINADVDSEFLRKLIDDETGILKCTIPEILASVFYTYSNIKAQMLAIKKSTVESIPYTHVKPLETIFIAINKYSTMAEASGTPTTPDQLIEIGMIVIANTNIFASDISRWNKKEPMDKTWEAFKLQLSKSQKAIKKSQPQQSLSDIGLNQSANAATIANEVHAQIAAQKAEEASRAEYIS